MGRHKGYDRQDLIAKALELFRDHGFAGTSTAMLVEGLAVNRNSLYSEFGSKQALFDACLKHYNENMVTQNFGPLEASDAGIDEIRTLVKYFAAATQGPGSGQGCLLCNTAIELGPNDPSGQGFVQSYFNRLSSSFQNALQNARSAKVLPASVDTLSESRLLTASLLGIFVMLRAQVAPEIIENAARGVLLHLDSICVASKRQHAPT